MLKVEKTKEGVVDALRVGAKEKNMKLYVKIIKLLIMANPTYGIGFLEEVNSNILHIGL